MSDPPKGTITFLFTDIVGSSRLWEKFPQRMGDALARHDAVMRAAAAAHGGHVFKTVGDAFCIAFETPSAAVGAAIQAQRALAAENWEEIGALAARMGIHTGTAEFRDGDYFGGTLNRVARIETSAHGGQILLSQITHELLEDSPLDGVIFKPLGSYRLRNLDRPEQLFQVVVQGLAELFPPPRSMEVLPNNLPAQATSFVGRQREMDDVKHRLEGTRLLTLTGTGGTGKTRLALEIGAQLITDYRDGVWLVELAPVADADRVVDVIAAALGARGEPERPLRQTLINFLRAKNLLLILDNCEHLLASAASLTFDILRACPEVKILATSRHSLGTSGEATFPVPPLAMFDFRREQLSGPDIAERLSQYEAVKLFIERAVAVRPDFTVTNDNAPALAEICSRLDGIPLAIELAAARVGVLDLRQIAERLDNRFRLLRSSSRLGGPPHQQTLQALIDWSHDLLSEQERILFRRMGTFVGGRTLAALESVCSGNGIEEFEVLDLLQQLVDKSLVTVERDSEAKPRYTMIESVWHYAGEKLAASGEAEALRDRHLDFFIRFAESAAPHLEAEEQKEWLDRCQREIYNIRFAFEWVIRNRRTDVGYRMVKALYRVFEIRGEFDEARDLIGQLITLPDEGVPLKTRADFRLAAGRLAWTADRYEEARRFYAQAQELYDALGDEAGSTLAGAFQGFLERGNGDFESAERSFERALGVGRKLGLPYLEAVGLSGLGSIAMDRGDLGKARQMKEQGLSIYERQKDRWIIGFMLWGIAQVAIAQKDHERARTALAEWTAITRALGNRWILPYILECQADLALETNQPSHAARFFGAAAVLHEHFGTQFPVNEQTHRNSSLDRLRQMLGEKEIALEWETGRNTSPWELLEEG